MSHLESPLHNLSIKSMLAANSRLWGSCEADAHHGPQEQEPGVHWGKGTQQPKVQSPGHGHHQTLNQSPQSGRGTDEAPSHAVKSQRGGRELTSLLPYLSARFPHTGAPTHIPANTTWGKRQRTLACGLVRGACDAQLLTYRRDQGHLVARQPPLAVQLRRQDAEDHHLHGVSDLLPRESRPPREETCLLPIWTIHKPFVCVCGSHPGHPGDERDPPLELSEADEFQGIVHREGACNGYQEDREWLPGLR